MGTPKALSRSIRLRVRPTPAEIIRFLKKCKINRWNGCWTWMGYKDEKGYGQFAYRGKKLWAHRWAYAAFRATIPEEMDIDHSCKNPSCVNPCHLRRTTPTTNRIDRRKEEAPF